MGLIPTRPAIQALFIPDGVGLSRCPVNVRIHPCARQELTIGSAAPGLATSTKDSHENGGRYFGSTGSGNRDIAGVWERALYLPERIQRTNEPYTSEVDALWTEKRVVPEGVTS